MKTLSNFFTSKILERSYLQSFLKPIFLAQTTVRNQELARELERACRKNGGVLTYAEYSEIEQYGKFGFNSESEKFGKTNIHQRWAEPLVTLCEKHKIKEVIEFGSGDGSLGVEMAKLKKNLFWSGVETNESLVKLTVSNFLEAGLKRNLLQMREKIEDLLIGNKCLAIFSYSLDSLAPEIFINTTKSRNFPDSILGIKAAHGQLSEVILTKKDLAKRKISFEKGIFRQNGQIFDLSSFRLYPGQRAYISLASYSLVYRLSRMLPRGSVFVAIDEFRPSPPLWNRSFLGLPKDLYARSKDCKDLTRYYKNAGKNLLYFPLYLKSFSHFLTDLGFRDVANDFEQKMGRELLGKRWINLRADPWTYAFVGTSVAQPKEILRIDYPSL